MIAKQTHKLRIVWLNFHLGGAHWMHSDLSKHNLLATHSCPICNSFRKLHWGPKQAPPARAQHRQKGLAATAAVALPIMGTGEPAMPLKWQSDTASTPAMCHAGDQVAEMSFRPC